MHVGDFPGVDRRMKMAQADKNTRGVQLVKTLAEGSVVRFYDRRTDGPAFAQVDVATMPREALIRAALHGVTQNLLDASNKPVGDARIAHIRQQAEIVQAGGWASAPSEVNIGAVKAKMVAAMVAKGMGAAEAAAMVEALGV
jgi:hypothetical protein